MLITKKINNNVAMAQDAEGNELVVFGRGIGFHSTPYELEDESRLQRVFHHVDNELMQTIQSISPEVIGVALDIVKLAEETLNCTLNPNLYLTLADHLQFAAERFADGVVIENPLAAEIPSVYPAEYELGWRGIRIMADVTGIELPEPEAYAIALHIANAETGRGSLANTMDDVMKVVHVIDDITHTVEEELDVTVDRVSHDYLRFTAHLRYLIKRLSTSAGGIESGDSNNAMFKQLARENPRAYRCATRVTSYFNTTHGWNLSDNERFYLLVYICRLDASARRRQ